MFRRPTAYNASLLKIRPSSLLLGNQTLNNRITRMTHTTNERARTRPTHRTFFHAIIKGQ